MLIRDNGRGIPTDPHPKYKPKSALEIILTTLHSGGKFNSKVYATSGGLHGVGVSVVNALSDELVVEVARDRQSWVQTFSRGKPTTKLKATGPAPNRRGTTVTFHPDPDIFGKQDFKPERLYAMARSKSYLFRGVEIRWKCDPKLLGKNSDVPAEENFHFEGGLKDYVISEIGQRPTVVPQPFSGEAKSETNGTQGGKVEWAVWWPNDEEGFVRSYCNTVPTSEGGTHEAGFRSALVRGLKRYAELTGNRKGGIVPADDVMDGAAALVSVFIEQPQFQGQTKEKLVSVEATKLTETVVGDNFEHWLTGDKEAANVLLEHVVAKAYAMAFAQEGAKLALPDIDWRAPRHTLPDRGLHEGRPGQIQPRPLRHQQRVANAKTLGRCAPSHGARLPAPAPHGGALPFVVRSGGRSDAGGGCGTTSHHGSQPCGAALVQRCHQTPSWHRHRPMRRARFARCARSAFARNPSLWTP